MGSRYICSHYLDSDVGLFVNEDDNQAWVGLYDSSLTHQTSEPPYRWVAGCGNYLEYHTTAFFQNLDPSKFI